MLARKKMSSFGRRASAASTALHTACVRGVAHVGEDGHTVIVGAAVSAAGVCRASAQHIAIEERQAGLGADVPPARVPALAGSLVGASALLSRMPLLLNADHDA
jgi:hypothetical protein